MRLTGLCGAMLVCGLIAPARAQNITGGAVTGTSLTIGTLNTGVVLQVSGAVSADRRYVTMGMHPQSSTLDGIDTFVVNGVGLATGVRTVPFRPAQVGRVTVVDGDKTLLASNVPELKLPGSTLKVAVRKLADSTRSNVVLGLRGMEQAGVDVNATRDYAVPAGTMKEALLALLKTGAPDTDMVISSEDKVIQLMTQTQADNVVVTRTYYLQDLIANMPRYVGGATNLYATQGKSGGEVENASEEGDEPPATRPAGGAAKPATVRKPGTASTSIEEMITSNVRPEIWKINGGKVGEIFVVGDRVTIKAPASVHALLDGPSRYNPNAVPLYVNYAR